MGLILIYGTVDLGAIVRQQSGVVLGVLPAWGVFLQPFAAVLFLTAAIAENKRIPFDLPEAESELIAGYYTEYSAMKMGLFMFAEFIEIAIVGALFTTLFLGGYNLPYMNDAGFPFPGGAHGGDEPRRRGGHAAARSSWSRSSLVCSFQILVRWSLPRFRYDQVLSFAWKIHAAAGAGQSGGHRGGRVAAGGWPVTTPIKPPATPVVRTVKYERKQYWNEPTHDAVGERVPARDRCAAWRITGGSSCATWASGSPAARARSPPTTPKRRAADYAPANRGKHVLTQRPDGTPQCIACNMCATVCPAKVIEIEAGFDPTIRRTRSSRCASRSTIRAASSAACASRPARKTPSAWPRRSPTSVGRPLQHVAHDGRDADLESEAGRAKPYPPKPVALKVSDSILRGRESSKH